MSKWVSLPMTEYIHHTLFRGPCWICIQHGYKYLGTCLYNRGGRPGTVNRSAAVVYLHKLKVTYVLQQMHNFITVRNAHNKIWRVLKGRSKF